MGLRDHALRELHRSGLLDPDSDYDGEVGKAVMRLIEVFADQGHSGFSAHMTVNAFERLAKFKLLTPLTGADDEWSDDIGDGTLQNRRLSSVFKGADGICYDIDAAVSEWPDGSRSIGPSTPREPIAFPYMPPAEPKVFKVDEDGNLLA